MQNQILVNLGGDHTYECATDIIGRAGESKASCLNIEIPEKLSHCWLYIDFEKPNGEKIRTSRMKNVYGVVQYEIPKYILAESGEIKVQLVFEDDGDIIWKSSVKKYLNEQSINAEDTINDIPEHQKQDFLTEAQRILNELSQEIDDIAQTLSNDQGFVDIVIDNIFADTRIAQLQDDINNRVPQTRTVNGKPLNKNIILVPTDIGASPTGHTHLVADIKGTLPIEKGGTNANTLEQAKYNLGISHIETMLKAYLYNGTQGLAYELNGDAYVCKGIGTATESGIIISPIVEGIKVTSIGDVAFMGNQNIVAVFIPDSVTSIGDSAFASCRNLASIVIPDSVTTIGVCAFMYCDSLKSVVIPDSVTAIEPATFINCPNLASVTIGNSVVYIGEGAFGCCTSLESLVIPSSVTSIDANAFVQIYNLKDIYVPWAEGAVADAPWGATNATIHYNSEV